ncbi:MAG TPA: winged helix-turn-helix domain-containing protein [Micromonosporaceae bacterium]
MSSSSVLGPDIATLRATAHPTRQAILRLLGEHTTLTATECARRLGVSSKTCSYHLHVLADAHLVAEVVAPGRNRPWRLADSPAVESAGRVADDLVRGNQPRLRARVRRDDSLLGTAASTITRATQSPDWSDAVAVHAHLGSMTPDEIARWAEDVERVTRRHVRRAAAEPDNAGRRSAVQLLFVGFPSDV